MEAGFSQIQSYIYFIFQVICNYDELRFVIIVHKLLLKGDYLHVPSLLITLVLKIIHMSMLILFQF